MEPFLSFPGTIHLITKDQELSLVLKALSAARILGFDTETRPSFKVGEIYKVALLQLATDTDAYLIRLHGISDYSGIKELFENEAVLKVGLALKDDFRLLQKTFSFTPKNFVDLQNLAKTKGIKNMGLKGMSEEVLKASITKGPKLTNWEAKVLTEPQLKYAATDAWIGFKIYQVLSTLSLA